MKFSCNREEIIKNLNIAQRATDPKSNISVLRNVLFDLRTDRLHLIGFDHRIGIRTSLACTVEKEGAITVPCTLLLEVLSVMTDDNVYFTLDDSVLTMECGKSKYHFHCITAEDFPPFPKDSGGKSFAVDAALLEQAVRRTIFATNPDDPRAFIGGVFMTAEGGDLVFVSTDMHRLTYCKVPEQNVTFEQKGIIIPTRTLGELLRILSAAAKPEKEPAKTEKTEKEEEKKTGAKLTVTVQSDSVAFDIDGVYMISRIIKADYPNYDKVLPSMSMGTCRVARGRLISAVRGASIMARAKESQNIIECAILDNDIQLTASTQDIGSAIEEVDIDKKGKNIKATFNSRYLLEFLNVVDDDEIIIDYTEELKAMLFHTDTPNYKYVLMPIKV